MDRSRVQAQLPHPVQCAVKAGELLLSKVHLVRLQGVGHAQVGEGAGDAQMFQPVQPLDGRPVLRRDTQPVHPRVQGQVDLDRLSLGGQGPAVGLVGHRLGEVPPPEQGHIPGRGVAQDKDGPPDPVLPQGNALGQGGRGEGPHPLPPKPPGRWGRPVAIAVRLHHRHEPALWGEGTL